VLARHVLSQSSHTPSCVCFSFSFREALMLFAWAGLIGASSRVARIRHMSPCLADKVSF
jgi:hypothetical protein